MVVFTDQYEHVIDLKGRLAIPYQYRVAVKPEIAEAGRKSEEDSQITQPVFYAKPTQRCLELIPEATFLALAQQTRSGLSVSADEAKLKRWLFATASRLVPDFQGRVIVPTRYMREGKGWVPGQVGLHKDVLFVGVGDRIELWNRRDFESHYAELANDQESLAGIAQRKFGAGTTQQLEV